MYNGPQVYNTPQMYNGQYGGPPQFTEAQQFQAPPQLYTAPTPAPVQPFSPNVRLVRIVGIPQATELVEISESVSSGFYGPLFSIRFGNMPDLRRYVDIVFRDAHTINFGTGEIFGAQGYFMAMRYAKSQPVEMRDPQLWAFDSTVMLTISVHTYEHRQIAMMLPDREAGRPAFTRRLTLVGPLSMFRYLNRGQIMGIIHRHGTVMVSHVQRDCFYNFGNATIVFSNVEAAVEARRLLLRFIDRTPRYCEMKVTHSKCPCETQVLYVQDSAYLHYARQNPQSQ